MAIAACFKGPKPRNGCRACIRFSYTSIRFFESWGMVCACLIPSSAKDLACSSLQRRTHEHFRLRMTLPDGLDATSYLKLQDFHEEDQVVCNHSSVLKALQAAHCSPDHRPLVRSKGPAACEQVRSCASPVPPPPPHSFQMTRCWCSLGYR